VYAIAAAFAALVSIGALSVIFCTLRFGIGPVPSSPKVRDAVIELAGAHEIRGAMYELGAGWGTLAWALAQRFPHAAVIAYEISPVPYAFMRLRTRFFPRANVQIRRADFHRASLAGASLVVCYLFPGAMHKLRPKLEAELCSGTPVISSTFAVSGWTPFRVVEVADLYHTKVYEYRAGG